MSLLCGVGFYLAANQIHGFDIRRKLWQDIVKADGVETELTDLGSNMDGRSLPFPSEELADLDRAVESYLSKYAPDVAERNLPLFHDEQQDLDDTVESYVTNDDPDLADRNFPIIDDQQQELAEQDAALSDLNGDLQDVSKRNSLTMFDLLSEIVKIRDDMQEQIDELKEGWKLGHFWVGGTDLIKENQWMWVHSQTPLTTSAFQDWGRVGPDNHSGREHCLQLRFDMNVWNDVECNSHANFICEREIRS